MAAPFNKELWEERHKVLDEAIDKVSTDVIALVKVTTQLVVEVQSLKDIHAPGTQADQKSNRIAITAIICSILFPTIMAIGSYFAVKSKPQPQPITPIHQKAQPPK